MKTIKVKHNLNEGRDVKVKHDLDKGQAVIIRYETATLKRWKGFKSQMAMWTKINGSIC